MAARIHHLPATGSTNADLLALAREGEPDGSWVRADVQTAGKGRLGRVWVSPAGNLYASRLVRLAPGDPPPASLALVAGLAVDAAVQGHVAARRLMLKWPNDLLLDGAKLAGILLEAGSAALVIGIGVNLAAAPEGLGRPVASLAEAAGRSIAPDALLLAIEEALAPLLLLWREEGVARLARAWLERAHPIGTPLSVQEGEERITGTFEGLDPAGALLLGTASGVRTIHAGDVLFA